MSSQQVTHVTIPKYNELKHSCQGLRETYEMKNLLFTESVRDVMRLLAVCNDVPFLKKCVRQMLTISMEPVDL